MKRRNLEALFRSQKGFNDTFAMTSLNRFFDSKNDFLKHFTRKSLEQVPQKSKKYDFFKLEILLRPMIINEKTQLERVVSFSQMF